MTPDYQQLLQKIIRQMTQANASDLHLSPGHMPMMRVDFRLVPVPGHEILDPKTSAGLAFALLTEERKNRFLGEKELDFAYLFDQDHRFRVNVYQTKGYIASTLRHIPNVIPTTDELNLPPIVKLFSKIFQGFVLIVGPNGHGKSTTLAALLNIINRERTDKIITIEDPIEYIFTPINSIIDQRELYHDTLSFQKALRSTFRENVNVIMVGEMRDYETISAAVTAAETGHLVFASLHTNNAVQTIDRIIDSFPPAQQAQVRIQLANTLSGIISQRLLPRLKGGLIPAVEVLIANHAVRNLIRENRIQQLNAVIDMGFNEGMISMNRSLAELVKKNEITIEQAEFYSLNPKELKELL